MNLNFQILFYILLLIEEKTWGFDNIFFLWVDSISIAIYLHGMGKQFFLQESLLAMLLQNKICDVVFFV